MCAEEIRVVLWWGRFAAASGIGGKFVAKLADDGVKHRTIKSYLSGVRNMHIMEGLGKQPLEQLYYVLRGVKRCEGERGMDNRDRLPI